MNFFSKHYLPNSEERIGRLRKIIDARPVAILASGPSITDLEKRIFDLHQADICYFGFNRFFQEINILREINASYSLYADSCADNLPFTIDSICNFLDRNEDNMLISSFGRENDAFSLLDDTFDLNRFLSTYDKKLLFFSISYDRTAPNKEHPLHFISGNTLQMVIQLAIIGKASKFVIFGADGGVKQINELYYRQDEYYNSPQDTIILDTNLCFNPIMPVAIRNVFKTYNLPKIDILNCSAYSYYTPFPKISYDFAFEYLLSNKQFKRNNDLRIPKLTVISIVIGTIDHLKSSIENLMSQSYPNFEHIIIFNNDDNQITDLKLHFPQIKWIFEDGCEWGSALEKAISIARGEYLYYYPTHYIFANPDWFNICIEILENHPDISLVWGLSQAMAENGASGRIFNVDLLTAPPPQGKDFIYSWLKTKMFFKEGCFCIRKSVFKECFPFSDANSEGQYAAWLSFNYNFNVNGYLPFFVPLVAAYNKVYFDQGGHRPQGDPIMMHLPYYAPVSPKEYVRDNVNSEYSKYSNAYTAKIIHYRNLLLKKSCTHYYRGGSRDVVSGNFNRFIYLFYELLFYLPKSISRKFLFAHRKIVDYWDKEKWKIFIPSSILIFKRFTKLLKRKE